MDTQLLEAFVAVADTESFSMAAEELHLTQSAVSKRIALLEQQLDCRLFDRIARSVTLTEAGTTLLPRANRILGELAESRQTIADLSGSVSGRLKLAISHHVGLRRLPSVLKQFTGRYPDVQLDVAFMDSERAYQAIMHGQHELAVVTLSPDNNPKLITKTVWPDPMSFVTAPNHPIINLKKPGLSELEKFPAILPEASTYTRQIVQQLFDDQQLKLTTTMTTNYLETIKEMVSIGLGWSLLPKHMMDDQLRELKLPTAQLTRDLGYVHHREKSLSNAAKAFIEILDAV